MEATLERTRWFVEDRTVAASARLTVLLETLAVLVSPPVLYRFLRLRGIGPPQLPDPSMHTTFIIEPQDVFSRYHDLFDPTSRLREASRVAFLVPARLSYLLFGALPGFFVFRYVLALIAVGPLYLLLKRLYGRWAGFVGIAIVMSSPVIVTAWSTDYPDSAAVSYLIGGISALALSWEAARWRTAWLIAGGCLMTMSVWTHGVAVPLVAVTLGAYLLVRLSRARPRMWRDLGLLVATAAGVTLVLAVLSKILIGQFNYISPTLRSAQELSTPAMLSINHSTSARWAVYDNYLLVPPALVLAYLFVFARRWRSIGTSQLFIGLTGALSLAVFAYLQFLGSLQTLEMHYFSSTLWASITILEAVLVAELTLPIARLGTGPRRMIGRRWGTAIQDVGRWIVQAVPAVLVLAVAMAYEIHPYIMITTWGRGAGVVAVMVVVVALAGRLVGAWRWSASAARSTTALTAISALAGVAAVVVLGAVLLLTVARGPAHVKFLGTVNNPVAPYSTALNGSMTQFLSEYAADAKLPAFVGHPTYKNEILLTWTPPKQRGPLQGPMGMFHNAYTWVDTGFARLTRRGASKISHLHAAQVLLMSLNGQYFDKAVRALAPFQPVVVHRKVLSHGTYHLHVELINLKRYLGHPARAS